MKLRDTQNLDADSPLILDSINVWASQGMFTVILGMSYAVIVDIHLWNVIDEILKLSMNQLPVNPFAVDHAYFNTLSLEKSVIVTGALLELLQKIHARSPPYAAEGMLEGVHTHVSHSHI